MYPNVKFALRVHIVLLEKVKLQVLTTVMQVSFVTKELRVRKTLLKYVLWVIIVQQVLPIQNLAHPVLI